VREHFSLRRMIEGYQDVYAGARGAGPE
jgi:hypothetical protein